MFTTLGKDNLNYVSPHLPLCELFFQFNFLNLSHRINLFSAIKKISIWIRRVTLLLLSLLTPLPSMSLVYGLDVSEMKTYFL